MGIEGLPPQWRDAIQSWASSAQDIQEVWLFGSRAKGNHREDSDVDLAIVTVGSSPGERLAALIELEEILLPVKVGLMPLEDKIALKAVQEHGVLLYKWIE